MGKDSEGKIREMGGKGRKKVKATEGKGEWKEWEG